MRKDQDLLAGTVRSLNGAITAAQLLARFVDKTPWAHLDIAGVVWNEKGTALGPGGESAGSIQASATPLPSLQAVRLSAQMSGNQFQISWPQDHLGWRLQIQTNGLSTNWTTVPGSTGIMSTAIPINPASGSVFLRLIYP